MIQHILNIKGTDHYFWVNENRDVVFRKGEEEIIIQSDDAKSVFKILHDEIESLEKEEKERNSFGNKLARKLSKTILGK